MFPFLVCFTSIRDFTYYKFKNEKVNDYSGIGGKLFLMIIVLSLLTLSILFISYIFLNLKLFFNLIPNDKYSLNYDVVKYIFIVGIISILLLFKKLKLFFKKLILINFFIASFIIWVLKINNISFIDLNLNNLLKIDNLNFINILFMLTIEIVYYIWSYISSSSYLSDWNITFQYKKNLLTIFNIIFFYLMILLYYLLLSN